MIITTEIRNKLAALGVTTHHGHSFALPDSSIFEPPCSIKWMQIEQSIELGAFSYAVSGYYFGCRIGRYCSFGEDIQIGRHAHPHHWFSTSPFFYANYDSVLDQPPPNGVLVNPGADYAQLSPPEKLKLTTIENDVWIGHGAFILPGVKIGTGAVIAARSVVTKDVPPYAIVAGSPADVKKYRFNENTIQKLVASRWWDYAPWDIKGLPVDNFDIFFEKLDSMKRDGLKPYAPQKFNITSLI